MRALVFASLVFVGCGEGGSATSAGSPAAPASQPEESCAALGPTAFRQGPRTPTGLPTDVALDGAGFFVVRTVDGLRFTRDGRFTLDDEGHFLHAASGGRVQKLDAAGVVDLELDRQLLRPYATSSITLKANLDANAPMLSAFDPANAASTAAHRSSLTVYSALGDAVALDVFWAKAAPGSWTFHALVDGWQVTGGIAGTPVVVASGTATFDATGRLSGMTQASSFIARDATEPQPLNFNFGTATSEGGTGLDGVTQFASLSSTTFTGQDGSPPGVLQTFAFSPNGELLGTYSNGQVRLLGRLAVAVFPSAQALRLRADGLAAETVGSGAAVIGPADDFLHGTVVPGAFERVPALPTCR